MSTTVKGKKFKRVPPEGGWGYVICAACVLVHIVTSNVLHLFGMMYNDFIVEMEMGSTTVVLISGAITMGLAVAGYFTSSMLKFMTFRQVSFLAAVLFNIGTFATPFTYAIPTFFICQLLQSVGYGFLFNLTISVINDYFLEKRLFAISIVQTFIGILAMVTPMIIKIMLEEYGYRGMLLLISAISMNLFVAVALMQPIAWHEKIIEIPEENVEKEALMENKEKNNAEEILLLGIVNGLDSGIQKNEDETVTRQKDAAFQNLFKNMFDMNLMKTFITTYASIGLAITLFTDNVFIVILPQALYNRKWTQENVAWALSVFGFGDLAARIYFIIFNKWLYTFGSKEVHLFGVGLAILSRIGILYINDVTPTLAFLFVIGVSRCFFLTVISLVIVDSVGPEKFTAAMGILMLLTGIFNLLLGPAVGAVRDLTQNYNIVFWILNGLLIGVVLLWMFERFYRNHRKKDESI